MRSFDLKAALSGEPVIAANGKHYTFVEVDKSNGTYPLMFGSERDGKIWSDFDGMNGYHRLTMAPRKVKKTVYVNFYPGRVAYWNYEPMSAAKDVIATAVPVEIEVSE